MSNDDMYWPKVVEHRRQVPVVDVVLAAMQAIPFAIQTLLIDLARPE